MIALIACEAPLFVVEARIQEKCLGIMQGVACCKATANLATSLTH